MSAALLSMREFKKTLTARHGSIHIGAMSFDAGDLLWRAYPQQFQQEYERELNNRQEYTPISGHER